DSVRLNQVLTNILSNAIKYTHRGKVTLTVAEHEDDRILFSIADTGIGISQVDKDKVFDEFYQVEGSMGGSSHGFGLGLAITRQLVHLLKGEISVESQTNIGTTFNVTFPIVYEESTNS
ncbi:MAG: ATP-binding protein, partial [Spirochaetota bacterium]|nr:ATP-binding protein [Spirochaetota bacterium]